jgi:hypothetical protein
MGERMTGADRAEIDQHCGSGSFGMGGFRTGSMPPNLPPYPHPTQASPQDGRMRERIAGDVTEWRAILAALPRCCRCPAAAECEIDGRKHCLSCSSRVMGGSSKPLPYAVLLARIEDHCDGRLTP